MKEDEEKSSNFFSNMIVSALNYNAQIIITYKYPEEIHERINE
jgi:hypothetical protein